MRTFIAIELDDAIRSALEAVRQRTGLSGRSIRWVRPASIHLTLKFLGDIDPRSIPDVTACMRHASRGVEPFIFRVEGLGCFPDARRPRVFWAGVDEPSGILSSLQSRLEEELQGSGFRKEARAFRPHLTLARFKGRVEGASSQVLTGRDLFGEQEAAGIILFQSELRPSGAVYTPLATVPFGEEPRAGR